MKTSLRTKFIVPALFMSFAFLFIIGFVNYTKLSGALTNSTQARLIHQADSFSRHLASWTHRNTKELVHLAKDARYRNSLKENFLGQASRKNVADDLKGIVTDYPFFDIIILADAQGTPIASSDMEAAQKYPALAGKADVAVSKGNTNVYQTIPGPLTQKPVIPITVPVENGDLKGLLTAYVNLQFFRSTFMDDFKAIKGSNAYLLNSRGLVISHPDHTSQTPMDFILNMVEAGLDRDFASHSKDIYRNIVFKNEEGNEVCTAAVRQVEGTDLFVVVSALDKVVYAGARIMVKWIMGVGLALLLVSALGIWGFLEFSIIRPLETVRDGLKDVAKGEGDLTRRLKVSSKDEVGDLAVWFNRFMDKQQDMVTEIMDSAHSLASLSTQISTTASQFASSATEMVTSVSEISTTGEQVKETVRLSNDKAEAVAQSAEDAETISQGGLSATARNMEGMFRIKDEMEYVAESIVKLSEQTQNIADIIDAVNELANQSNLLSVNASIEAAKAGEFGKGFAVVAQEVKSLADQSKQATEQVKNILQEIQRATSTAVMATERGSKAVDTGSMLSAKAEEAIQKLSQSTSESAMSSRQIAASSQQQLAGMEQLAQALENIKFACEQNVGSARQLEESTDSLKNLGQGLKNMAEKFRV